MIKLFNLLIMLATFGLFGCTNNGSMFAPKQEEYVSPVVGKWAEKGKCSYFTWYFSKTNGIYWGQNKGQWSQSGNNVNVKAKSDMEGGDITLNLTYMGDKMKLNKASYGPQTMRPNTYLYRCP